MRFVCHILTFSALLRCFSTFLTLDSHIKYYYGQTGNKSTSVRRSCRRIAEQYGIGISFEDSIFDGIIPKKSSDAVLTVNTTTTRYWLYAAGDGSANWENDYAEGIMAIGWPGMGDLSVYGSKVQWYEVKG